VYRVSFAYIVGSEFSLGKPEGVACTNDSVDGLIFAPDGDLLVSAKGDGVHKVNPQTGAFSTIKLTVPAFHIMLDPSGTKVWVSSIPGTPATIPFPVIGKSTVHVLTGDDGALTTIAWADAGNAYYTSSGPFGGGNFGRLDLATLTTKRILGGLPAAHGMVFDPLTRSLMLMGTNHVTQISVGATPTIVSDWKAPIDPLDQGATDGKGHLFVACNCGRMLFIDYSASRKIADHGNFTATVQLVEELDDIAPIVGPGAESAASPKNVLVTEEQGRIRIVLEAEILFDLDKDNLKPSAEVALARIKASIIDKYPGARLIIEGHTDDRGTQEYNRTLSARRAQTVAAWLSRHGIEGSRLQTVGYGKTKPMVPNTSEENRARNRRVEIVVVK
jgi:outer membrane protein OmpA-like peptidoglycan-associated protein